MASAGILKAKALFSIAYGTGMRAREVTRLKVGDIDSEPIDDSFSRHGMPCSRHFRRHIGVD